MADTIQGMNVAEVTRIGRQLQTEARNMGDLVSRVRTQVAIAERNWEGNDASHFIKDWQGSQQQLNDLQSQLSSLGGKAMAEAKQQDTASK